MTSGKPLKLISVSKFRSINVAYLKAMKESEFVVSMTGGDTKISHVLIPYSLFIEMQSVYMYGENGR